MPPTPPSRPPTIRLRSPGEIVSAVPYLVGFAPSTSLVAVGLAGKQVALTCRLDLAAVADGATLDSVVAALIRAGATRVLLVAYSDVRAQAQATLTVLRDQLAGAGLAVVERISVIGASWFDEDCTDTRCCPAAGVAIADHDNAPSTMGLRVAIGGYRGARSDIEADCHPNAPLLTAMIRSEIVLLTDGTCAGGDEDVIQALIATLGWSTATTAVDLARSSVACLDGHVRDALYAILAPALVAAAVTRRTEITDRLRAAGLGAGDLAEDGTFRDGDARSRVLARLLSWVRNLPDDTPGVTMSALVVAAVAHWSEGDGARTRILIERAQRLDAVPMAMLSTLSACLVHGVRFGDLRGWEIARPGGRPGRGRGRRSVL